MGDDPRRKFAEMIPGCCSRSPANVRGKRRMLMESGDRSRSLESGARCGRGVGKVWARCGQGVGKVWARCGRGVGEVSAKCGARCGQGVGNVWGNVWASLQTPRMAPKTLIAPNFDALRNAKSLLSGSIKFDKSRLFRNRACLFFCSRSTISCDPGPGFFIHVPW